MTIRHLRGVIGGLALAAGMAAFSIPAQSAKPHAAEREAYEVVPMPAGFQVIATELEGPVFADAQGRTLYQWPRQSLRNGAAGDNKGTKSLCNDAVSRETAGLQSPWPAGLLLPDLDTRPSCAKMWPPVPVAADAQPVGKWTIAARNDGTKQWAYGGYPLYTSILDKQPGDTYGGMKRTPAGEGPALRSPVGPPSNVPSEFTIAPTTLGRLVVTFEGYSVYSWDGDRPNASNCDAECAKKWAPVLAPQSAIPHGDWTVIQRSPGIRQWAFRKKALYARVGHQNLRGLDGSDVPGWHNVYTQRAPAPPKAFTEQDSLAGQVLADAHGKTIYVYNCGDDLIDELACDHPDTSQALHFTVCGRGDPDRCLKTFPPILAAPNAKSDSRVWTVIDIDPKTGHRATPDQPGSLHVWAYRDRPVYTFSGDQKPGDIFADSWGEFSGSRNGFKAFWLREDFFGNAG